MIEFYCEICGQKIHAPTLHSGEKGQCPRCKHTVIVPDRSSPEPAPPPEESPTPPVHLKYSDYELTLLNVREQSALKDLEASQTEQSEKAADGGPKRQDESEEAERAAERKYPWLIDIFLYPFSLPGLRHLAIFAGIPPLMRYIRGILPIQLSCFIGLVSLIVNVLIFLYIFWYLAECIRDSADGWVRAPRGMGALPDMPDMFRQLINTIGCLAFFLMPVGIYVLGTGRFDIVTCTLLLAGMFFYPIGFLSVVLFDSVSGLNPHVLVRSIANTYWPYLGLVLLYVFFAGLALVIVVGMQVALLWEVLFRFVLFYAAFILAHLTGRFYWRYRDKLKWNLESLRERQRYD